MSAHVVLINEELAMQMVITATLQTHHYRVTAVLAANETAPPLPPDTDIVLITLPSPKPNGLLSHYLADTHQTIALVPDHQTGSRAMTAGADDYLVDPFNRTELLAHIQIQLRLKDAKDKSHSLQTKLIESENEEASANISHNPLLPTKQQRHILAETFSQIISVINKSLANEDVLGQILDHLTRVLPYDSASIMLLQGDMLKNVAKRSIHPRGRTGTIISLDRFAHVHEVVTTGAPVIISDTTTDPRWQQLPRTSHIRCWMGIPITIQDQVIGILNLSNSEPHRYGKPEAEIAVIFSRQAAIAIENAQLHARLQNIASDLDQQVVGRTEELTEAYNRLQELGHIRAGLLQNVTQELRGPISNLALYLDLWERAKAEKQAQYLNVLKEQSRRLVTLMEGLIQLSQLDLMKHPLNFTPVDVNSVVVAAINSQQQRAHAMALKLDSELQPHLPPIRGDWRLLVEMLTHLLENAIRFTDQGNIRVHTRFLSERQLIEIQVQDTGAGISAADIPHVFDPFFESYEGKPAGKLGIGLGLTMAKAIVELHHGEIGLQSVSGNGLTALVQLPVKGDAKNIKGL
ncbi:MAG: GAF domain-containing protein [Ardenticatenaceae bacterium]|nr:GAF domain-containing protein [Anaerolineales bacterium]MCB8921037.1 GAF domain-containing protein [Ardenticatenaceae bacterium]MCB8991199.1 GAF domain-containing protein [Ardenticatenaceae bacterium]MCB9004168.1 GAF domain-containing protein [Ardenticatenaceae bacterium]